MVILIHYSILKIKCFLDCVTFQHSMFLKSMLWKSIFCHAKILKYDQNL